MEETDIKVEVEEIVEPLALVKRVEVEGEAEVMELLENSNKISWVEDLLRIYCYENPGEHNDARRAADHLLWWKR